MSVPAPWIRRPFGALLILGLALAVSTLPLLVFVFAAASLVLPGRWRPLRLMTFALVYLALEVVGLLIALDLWVFSGFGWKLRSPAFQRRHYTMLWLLLGVLMTFGRRLFNLTVVTDGPSWSPLDDGVPGSTNAMIVISRHAGPGDSFLMVNTLMNRDHLRQPRIVLKETMQLDPLIDVYLNRLPNQWVPVRRTPGEHTAAKIGRLAAGLGEEDALLIFPEGGNFTPTRRRRAIDKLRRKGMHDEADRAEGMQHLLAPRAGGLQAALAAAPHADCVFVAHTGLEHLSTLRDLWNGLPMDTEVHLRWWFVPAAEVPRDPEQQVAWLYEWWARIDEWIAGHRAADAPVSAG